MVESAESRTSAGAFGRSAASAVGVMVGAGLAALAMAVLFPIAFDRIGEPIAEQVVADWEKDASGVEDLIAAMFMPIVGALAGVMTVLILLSPILVVVPLTGQWLALRLAKADRILRTSVWTLLVTVVLVIATIGVASTVDGDPPGWTWPVLVGTAGFLGRLAVERPAKGNPPSP